MLFPLAKQQNPLEKVGFVYLKSVTIDVLTIYTKKLKYSAIAYHS